MDGMDSMNGRAGPIDRSPRDACDEKAKLVTETKVWKETFREVFHKYWIRSDATSGIVF